jgi:glycine cleavage system H protein
MDLPENLLYTDQHEWVRVEGDVGTVGITEFAQDQLGDLTFVELPEIDTEVSKGDEAVAIESCKAAAGVYAPADGTVQTVNEALEDNPGLANSDPYNAGWIFQFQIAEMSQLEELMDVEAYRKFLDEQG